MKLSLEQTWTKCLKMWKWIAENDFICGEDGKRAYFREHPRLKVPDKSDCYFCDYTTQTIEVCRGCPGALVENGWRCTYKNFSYNANPKKFYQELLRLNKKRKASKK